MIRVTLTKVLSDEFASDYEASQMTDEQIIELCQEDLLDIIIDGASWTITREEQPCR